MLDVILLCYWWKNTFPFHVFAKWLTIGNKNSFLWFGLPFSLDYSCWSFKEKCNRGAWHCKIWNRLKHSFENSFFICRYCETNKFLCWNIFESNEIHLNCFVLVFLQKNCSSIFLFPFIQNFKVILYIDFLCNCISVGHWRDNFTNQCLILFNSF